MNEDGIRRLLGENAAHTRRALAHGDKLRSACSEAMGGAQGRIAGLNPGEVFMDDVKAADYQRALMERGWLSTALSGR